MAMVVERATLKECARRVWEECRFCGGAWYLVWKTGRAANTWNVETFDFLFVDNCRPGEDFGSGEHTLVLACWAEEWKQELADVLAVDPFAVISNGTSFFRRIDNPDQLEERFRYRHSRRRYQLRDCVIEMSDLTASPFDLEDMARIRDTSQQVNPETVTAEDEADKEMPWEGLSKEDYYALADTGPSVHPCDECKHDFDPDDLFCMACRWNPENWHVGQNAGSAARACPPSTPRNRHNDEKAAPIVGYGVAVQDMLGDLIKVHHTAFPLEAARVARMYADACMKQAQAVFVFPVRDSLSVGVGVTGPPGIQREDVDPDDLPWYGVFP